MKKKAISTSQKALIKKLYYKDLYSMQKIADHLGVSLDAVVYFFRNNKLKRRSFAEVQKLRFYNKKPSFKRRKLSSVKLRELAIIGAMLYWGEGYKGSPENRSPRVDFANSDPKMIKMFLHFLTSVYDLDYSKLRVYLYCYANQDPKKLISFWSKQTRIPKSQFTKPYVRKDYKTDGRKMKHGLVHIRYGDKKLLIDLISMIDYYVNKYASVG